MSYKKQILAPPTIDFNSSSKFDKIKSSKTPTSKDQLMCK